MHIDLEWLSKIIVIGATVTPLVLIVVKAVHHMMTKEIMEAIEVLRADTVTLKAQNRRREAEQRAQKERTNMLADLIQEMCPTSGSKRYRDRIREIDRAVENEFEQINIDHDEEQKQIKEHKKVK